LETTRATIAVSPSLCWYLDSNFCSGFHELKKLADPDTVQMVGLVILFGIWSIVVIFMLVRVLRSFRKQLSMKVGKIDSLGKVKSQVEGRWNILLEVFAKQTVLGTALRLVVIMIPWPFYLQIFVACWDCYDFQAAMTHEIGHALGLGHPDLVPQPAPGGTCTEGEIIDRQFQISCNASNVYTSLMLPCSDMSVPCPGRYPNTTTCDEIWNFVEPNLPPGCDVNSGCVNPNTGIRWSIMESMTTHNPVTCIREDDLEGINTLYPVCDGAVTDVICDSTDLNLGWLRMISYVFAPLVLGLLISIFFHHFIQRKEQKQMKKQKAVNLWIRGAAQAGAKGRVALETSEERDARFRAKELDKKTATLQSRIEVTVM
jgi:hypothetical protein